VRVGVEEGFEKGLAAEARSFGELVVSDVSRQLVTVFQAQTALKKDPGVEGKVEPRKVRKIGMLGAGLMGSGIAYVSANAGIDVRLKDRDYPSVARGLAGVRQILDERARRRSLTRLQADAVMARVTGATDYSGFKGCDLVVEAVFEDLSLKRKVLAEVEAACRPETIFASNTSSIPITQIAAEARRPENVVGMHYFSPVHKMPLLEVIATARTAPEVTATAVALGKKQGKTVIVVNDGAGFYTSRILAPYMNEAAYLLVEGADALEIDKALVELGFPVGPITLLDEVGLDVGAKVAHICTRSSASAWPAPTPRTSWCATAGWAARPRRAVQYDPDRQEAQGIDETVYDLLPAAAAASHGPQGDRRRVSLQMVTRPSAAWARASCAAPATATSGHLRPGLPAVHHGGRSAT
jgi:3-hydroxyacyl-CoA dehydrogenase/enoyl-CoA hydratase/3-hydroxybutyryl-CoA epimerase